MTHTVFVACVDTETLCLKLWDAIIVNDHLQKLVHLSLSKNINEALKRELDDLRKQYIQKKGYKVIEMYEHGCWKMSKTDNIVEQDLRESFSYRTPLREETFLKKIKSGSLLVLFNVILK